MDCPPTLQHEWEFHPQYGIIHTRYCAICKAYTTHLQSFYNSPIIKRSKDRDSLYGVFYFDGLNEGMSRRNEQISNLSKELGLTKLLLEEASKQLELERRSRQKAELDRVLHLGVTLTEGSILRAPCSTGDGIGRPRVPQQAPLPPNGPVADSRTANGLPATPSRIFSSEEEDRPRSLPVPPITTKPLALPIKNHKSAPSLPPRPEISTLQTAKTNPTLEDSVETWYDYYCVHQKSWPRGVRCDALHRPILSDLRADRAIARFRPNVPALARYHLDPMETITTNNIDAHEILPCPSPRNQFKNMVVEIFSQPGLYWERVTHLRLYLCPSVTYNAYNGSFPVTMDDVIRHFANSGITRKMAEEDFEPWAQNYKAGVNSSVPFIPHSSQTRRRRY